MRDVLVVGLVVWGCLLALKRPWVGVMVWTWLSIMNPHRYAFGFAFDAPLAAGAAIATLVGLAVTKDRHSPFMGAPTVWLALFTVWITLSWMVGLAPEYDYPQWNKVMKVFFMIFVALMLLRTKTHVMVLVWVCAGSLALLGAKGGFFTIVTGGAERVWGPPGSFIEDNNEFGLSLVMTIPLLRFLQLQLAVGWRRHVMTVLMLLCATAAAGTQSRGALLAISAMALVLWWRGKSRWLGGVVIVCAAVSLVAFMPDSWSNRMSSISNYEADRSALGRISAWWTAFGIAKDYIAGIGFNAARADLFARYSPYPDYVHAAHSIYFQVMGNHGFIGLFFFLMIFISTYLMAGRLSRFAKANPQARWCDELGAMCQVSLIGYGVGGAFLSLSYFDLQYNIMIMVVVASKWAQTSGWKTEPAPTGWERHIQGLTTPTVRPKVQRV